MKSLSLFTLAIVLLATTQLYACETTDLALNDDPAFAEAMNAITNDAKNQEGAAKVAALISANPQSDLKHVETTETTDIVVIAEQEAASWGCAVL